VPFSVAPLSSLPQLVHITSLAGSRLSLAVVVVIVVVVVVVV
jgi:hypothetical protein